MGAFPNGFLQVIFPLFGLSKEKGGEFLRGIIGGSFFYRRFPSVTRKAFSLTDPGLIL